MPGTRDTWNKPIPRQNIVIVRRAERSALPRSRRAELVRINALADREAKEAGEKPMDPNERKLWEDERKLVFGIGQDSTATKIQGGRKTRRRSLQRKTRKNRRH
jgi:hypothetical protein